MHGGTAVSPSLLVRHSFFAHTLLPPVKLPPCLAPPPPSPPVSRTTTFQQQQPLPLPPPPLSPCPSSFLLSILLFVRSACVDRIELPLPPDSVTEVRESLHALDYLGRTPSLLARLLGVDKQGHHSASLLAHVDSHGVGGWWSGPVRSHHVTGRVPGIVPQCSHTASQQGAGSCAGSAGTQLCEVPAWGPTQRTAEQL